jgi:hypothetical protein
MALRDDNSGFSVFALDHAQHARTIKKKLMEIRAERASDLVSGLAADWADYRRRVGVLEGIDEALHVCEDIERAERA